MNFTEWLTMGMENNWCGPLLCYTHDGLPTTETEDEEMMMRLIKIRQSLWT